MALVSGEARPDAGRVALAGRDATRLPVHARARLGVARSFQITSLMLDMTARDNAILAVQAHAGHAFRFWADARRRDSLAGPATAALERVGLGERADAPARALSHGERRQLEIALALAGAPRLLLLDEPMAGMGTEESARMVELLRGLKGEAAMLLVEHDMDAVFSLADRITVLVEGAVAASGPPERIRGDAAVRRAYLGDEAPAEC